ncbi:MAG: DUF58 domain-containing protein [Pseudomonadota bacterium]|nr:DUF58 domain-containing protein [Pseudomonadota bacterium]
MIPASLHACSLRFRERFADWVMRRHEVAHRDIVLHRRRIYILPTRYGFYYAAMLAVLLASAMNYNNSMVFGLTFLLAGLGANAMWYAHRNLLNVRVEYLGAHPVFAGDETRFRFRLHNPSRLPRIGLTMRWREQPESIANLAPSGVDDVAIPVPARQRGLLKPDRFQLFTRFPFGLFHAWSWLDFDMTALVYPSPSKQAPPFSDRGVAERPDAGASGPGEEDFSGLREYRVGDSMRRIAWKALARQENLLVKQYEGAGTPEVWLVWDDFHRFDTETRLSRLCRMVLQAEQERLRYGLRLPTGSVAPGAGESHKRACLEALALYDRDIGNGTPRTE